MKVNRIFLKIRPPIKIVLSPANEKRKLFSLIPLGYFFCLAGHLFPAVNKSVNKSKMKTWLRCFLYFTLFYLINGQEATKPWYEDMPAVAMDYKVHIDAGKEDCYYQYVKPGATFYVAFSVSIS